VEPDVLVNVTDLGGFFTQFLADTADYLCGRFGPRQAHWEWFAEIQPDFPQVYGGIFPLTRLSGRAIDYLARERARLSAAVGPKRPYRWPNDESFVASALMAGGFTCGDLNGPDRVVRSDVSLRTGVVHGAYRLLTGVPDGLVYHPVRDLTLTLEKAEQGLQRFHKPNEVAKASREDALWLLRMARTCLDQPGLEGAAVVPLTLIRELAGPQGVAAEQLAAEAGHSANPPVTAVQATNLYRRHFAPADGAPAIASVHAAQRNKPAGPYTTAAASDFSLGRRFPMGRFPHRFALPFAFDFAAETLLHTLHIQPQILLREPFLYIAQRERTHVVAQVAWKNLAAVHGTPDPAARPVFIFSIGRTGSTLLGKLIGCITPRSFLEPDTVTQLAASRPELAALAPALRAQLVWSAVAPFFDTYLGEGVDGRCVIKLRSQGNGLAADMAAVFPQARFVFMLRERMLWARSTFRAFRLSPEAVVGRLLGGVQALNTLRVAGVDLAVVSYEDVVADPQAAVGLIMGQDLTQDAAVMARLSVVMAQDSQAEKSIARDKTSRTIKGEDAWLAAFEANWQQRRPRALIEALGLPL